MSASLPERWMIITPSVFLENYEARDACEDESG